MGQQQLLLIVLGVIIVGVAIIVAITLFRQNAIDSKRDLIITENNSLASMAVAYYNKAKTFGGGGKSFIGWTIPNDMSQTPSGRHSVVIYSDSVIIIGTGNEVVTGNDSVKAETSVSPYTTITKVIN